MEQIQFDDKNMMDDALASQKFITETYNTFANECSDPQLKEQFVNLLEDEHRIQHEVFTEMQKRGWYQTEPAEQDKINQAKQKYLGQMNQ
ncbi:MAG TPA: spore coat protein [Firmicutes bacterium]|nr:spore coat protein [Bacillota bacterium]